MLSTELVIAASFGYLLLLFAIASWGDRRAQQGRSIIASPWVYALSMGVYCTAWTYFGSVGRAASAGVWFLPIYLGPTLAMVLGWVVLRKMVRIAKTYRITTIADFVASRYGKSPLLAGAVTLITLVGIVPYIALQLKAVSVAFSVMTGASGSSPLAAAPVWWADSTLYIALVLAGFTMVFGARHLDNTERHEGMVAAVAFESLVKLVAFLAVGVFVTFVLFGGPAELFAQVRAHPDMNALLRLEAVGAFPYAQWFGLTVLAMMSVVLLPRQFQVMVVENVNEGHLRRAAWAFPLYLLLINLFVLPIAFGGLLLLGPQGVNAETFVLTLPLFHDQKALAMLAFLGGLSAATGMVIVEAIAVSTMVCNDLVMPVLLRTRRLAQRSGESLTGWLLGIRRVAILVLLLLGYTYFHLAGEAYALVSIGLISFAAVAQFAPAVLGAMYWKGGTRNGVLAGLLLGFALWAYTLMVPSLAKSGWLSSDFLRDGLLGQPWLRPEQLFGLSGLDGLTHSLFWSLLANVVAFVGVSLWRGPSAAEASQALRFVDVFRQRSDAGPTFWRGTAKVGDLLELTGRFLGPERAQRLLADYAQRQGVASVAQVRPDAQLVQHVETLLAGAIGSASARVMVASVVQEEPLVIGDVMRILDEASQVRAYSVALEEKSHSLEQATAELRQANEQLKSLDALKDDFMSSVTHELRTPLTSIRALAELMRDDPKIDLAQRKQFIEIIVTESERLSRLVNQVLDMAKIESGNADWYSTAVDMRQLVGQAVQATSELFRNHGTEVVLDMPEQLPTLQADPDRLTQVLINLLANAVKFAPAGAGRVSVVLRALPQVLRVQVLDNGPGVPDEQRALVFEKFRQGGTLGHRPQGTGLGLPISRQIVEHFGGRIWVESAPEGGACFSFELPWTPLADHPLQGDTHDQKNSDR